MLATRHHFHRLQCCWCHQIRTNPIWKHCRMCRTMVPPLPPQVAPDVVTNESKQHVGGWHCILPSRVYYPTTAFVDLCSTHRQQRTWPWLKIDVWHPLQVVSGSYVYNNQWTTGQCRDRSLGYRHWQQKQFERSDAVRRGRGMSPGLGMLVAGVLGSLICFLVLVLG